MRASLVFGAMTALAAVAGCGSSPHETTASPHGNSNFGRDPFIPPDGGAGDGDSAVDAPGSSREAGDSGEGGEASANSPLITIDIDRTSLAPASDGGVSDPVMIPNAYGPKPFVTVTVVSRTGDMHADNLASATATVAATGDADGGAKANVSIKLGESDVKLFSESNTRRTVFSDIPLDLSALSSGPYVLTVQVCTIAGFCQQTSLTVWVDAGPIIELKSPKEGGYYKGSALVDLTVTQPGFEIVSVTMMVGQESPQPIPAGEPGSYRTTISFDHYVPPLEGDQLVTIRATNQYGTSSVVSRRFVSDSKGPTITDTKPASGSMIGRVISIEATVQDPAGVVDSSVVAVVANGESERFEVSLERDGDTNKYTKLFDTGQLPIYALYPTISFRARDTLGNENSFGYEVSLDNTPPMLDLDPPNVRSAKYVEGVLTCSWPYDPVGPDAVDDGSLVTQMFDVRAFIKDEGNSPQTGTSDFVLVGGIDNSRVQLLMLDDTSRPLVVDTSTPADGICDDANPELIPTSDPHTAKDAQVVDMVGVPLSGGADYTLDPSASCSRKPESSIPGPFCRPTYNSSKGLFAPLGSVQMGASYGPHSAYFTEVLGYAVSNWTMVYTVGPVIGDGLQCAGRQFDASNNLKDGWACLAVMASDTLGNKQVSRPIRTCVMASKDAKPCPEFRQLVSVSNGSTVEIQIDSPLLGAGGAPLKDGDEVIISRMTGPAAVNGRWTVKLSDGSGVLFSLVGSDGHGLEYCWYDPNDATRIIGCSTQVTSLTQTAGAPVRVTCATPHGFDPASHPPISVWGSVDYTGLNGVSFPINVIDGKTFELTGSEGVSHTAASTSGYVVATSALPDCTGTLKKGSGNTGAPVVDGTMPCKPWRSFGEDMYIH